MSSFYYPTIILFFLLSNDSLAEQIFGQEIEEDTSVEEVVVTAEGVPKSEGRNALNAISELSENDLKQAGQTNLSKALGNVPSITTTNRGGAGQQSSFSLRGAKSESTLVLFDGMELNDISSPTRTFNGSDFDLFDVGRIQVLPGNQSVLYGSEAFSGVINIIPASGKKEAVLGLGTEAGSYDTFKVKSLFTKATEKDDFFVGFSHLKTGGFSAAEEKDGNHERDGHEQFSLALREEHSFGHVVKINGQVRLFDALTDLDSHGGVNGDDPNFVEKRKNLLAQVRISLFPSSTVWRPTFSCGVTDSARNDRNNVDVSHPNEDFKGEYSGFLTKYSWINELFIQKKDKLSLGIDFIEEKSKTRWQDFISNLDQKNTAQSDKYGLFALNEWDLTDNLSARFGVREDHHSSFGPRTATQAGGGYKLPGLLRTDLFINFGTGYSAPSLFQLFDPIYGNSGLKPEKTRSFDFGFKVDPLPEVSFRSAFFQQHFSDLIIFNGSTYENIDSAVIRGFEPSISIRPAKKLKLEVSSIFNKTRDDFFGQELPYAPSHKTQTKLSYSYNYQDEVSIINRFVGHRLDYTGDSLPSHYVSDFVASDHVAGNFFLSGRVENLTNRKYQEVLGYGTAGRSYYVGIEAIY